MPAPLTRREYRRGRAMLRPAWTSRTPMDDRTLLLLRTCELLALDALRAWSGTHGDVLALHSVVAVSRELCRLGYAPDEADTVKRAAGVVLKLRTMPSGSVGADGGDLAALRDAILLIERQRAVAPEKTVVRAVLTTG